MKYFVRYDTRYIQCEFSDYPDERDYQNEQNNKMLIFIH